MYVFTGLSNYTFTAVKTTVPLSTLITVGDSVLPGGGWSPAIDLYEPGTVNISAVPVPAAVWLFGSGLLGLVGISRRKKEA